MNELKPYMDDLRLLDVTSETGEELVQDSGAQKAYFFLYLSSKTFVGQAGELLAQHVARARKIGITVLLMHETDAERHGCEFNRCDSPNSKTVPAHASCASDREGVSLILLVPPT